VIPNENINPKAAANLLGEAKMGFDANPNALANPLAMALNGEGTRVKALKAKSAVKRSANQVHPVSNVINVRRTTCAATSRTTFSFT